jgi:hypothetical protein
MEDAAEHAGAGRFGHGLGDEGVQVVQGSGTGEGRFAQDAQAAGGRFAPLPVAAVGCRRGMGKWVSGEAGDEAALGGVDVGLGVGGGGGEAGFGC